MRALSILVLVLTAGCVARTPPVVPPALAAATITRAGLPSSPEALIEEARGAALVCAGEQHDSEAHHQLQHALQLALLGGEREIGLGLEMLPWLEQPSLDQFVRGDIGERELLAQTRWEDRWGFDFAMYRPLFETARAERQQIVALNAPRELTRWIARHGLDALPPARRAELPELVLDDAEHRRFFEEAIGGSHGTHAPRASSDRFYVAQVLWDETMAAVAVSWLLKKPERQLLVLAGNGHCHESAIVRRFERRLPDRRGLSVVVKRADHPLPEAPSDFVVTLP